jgi:polyketide synthase 12
MGRQLYHSEPIFRQWIEKLNSEFLSISNNSFSLIKELIEPEKEEDSNIYLTNIAQPCILSIQIALTSLWISWGIYPNTIIGHSVGEIAAAFVAGRLTLKEAVQIIYHRSRVQNYNTDKGGRMLALFLTETEAKELISDVEDRVQIAAINSPKSVTLSGDEDVLETIYNKLSTTKPHIFKSWLKIENAFHSKQMERFNIYEELIQSLSNIKGDNHNNEFDKKCSKAILYSTVTGTRTDQLNLNGEYWWKNIRNPVLFNNGIQSIFNDMKGSNVLPIFIEISPHPVLSTTIIECFQEFHQSHKLSSIQTPLSIYSLKRKENEQQTILSSLCLLFSYFGSKLIDWNRFFNSRIYSQFLPSIKINPVSKSIISLIDTLPNYAFNHQIYWYESKDSVFSRRAIKKKHHPLLGYRLWHNETQTPTWKNVFIMNKDSMNLSYLLDHNIHGNILYPASAFIELVISAINQLLQYVSLEQQSITLQNIQFLSGLHLDNDDTIQLETVIIMPFKEFFIYSRRKPTNDSVRLAGISGNDIITTYTDESSLHKYSSKEWSLHCRGLINLKVDALLMSSMFDMESILNRLLPSNNTNSTIIAENENDIENLYQYFSECGLTFGSKFRSIKKLYRYKYEALSEITIPSTLFKEENSNKQEYICHPAILDGCFQGMISIVPGDFFDTFVPVSIDEITLCDRKKCFISIIEQSDTKFYATQSLNKSVKGLTSDKNFTTDILVFSETNQLSSSLTPIMIFRGFKIQNYSNQNISKSIIQKVEESNSMYHNNPKKVVPVNELIEHFCAYQSWKLTEFDSNSLDVFSQSTDLEQFWIIFSDQKFNIGKQIAEILVNHQVKNENITLIYLSTIHNSTNSFDQIIVNDISTISSIIRNLIQSKSYSKNSILNILFNWSIDLPMFNNTNDFVFQSQEQIGCGTLMYIVQSIYEIKFDNDPNIFILTENSQPINDNSYHQKDYNLVQSPIIGFARSIINEYKINRMKLIDLQFSHLSINLLNALIKELYSTINSSSNSSQNEEIVLSSYNNIIQRFAPEYSMIELSKYQHPNLTKTVIIPKLDIDRIHFQLEIPKSRQISDLQWIHNNNSSRNLSPTDVEIRIHCVSISFRDMLKVRGLHPYIRGNENEYDSDQIMGADFSGIIVRKGSQVNLNLNDRVFGTITNESVFKSHIISNEKNIVQAPSNLTMEQLSTLPTYLTVLYCLENRVHLQKGQTILIHTATSGVGLAFIQYAQMIGANIIATAGTEEKRAFLREKYQIEHVFNSRDLSFIPGVRQVAPNGVVDIIINSLSGIFINESLELLAPFGHFIELGKRDIYVNSKLSLFPLRINCTFHVIDLISVQKYSPETIQRLLKNISNLCQSKKLKPITPIEEFDASQIQQAFFTYSQAKHIGKFVIKIAESNEQLNIESNQTEEQIQQKRKGLLKKIQIFLSKFLIFCFRKCISRCSL